MKTKIALLGLLVIAVVLVSGCAQKTVTPTASTSPTQSVTATPLPSTTVSGLDYDLDTNNDLESDASNSDLEGLDSDLGEIESGL
ncbi:MAG TPA: hypothetical protein VJA47_03785 [archaeon]|nr:hypothetical protein [archaeon]